jgi:hypothetical protein
VVLPYIPEGTLEQIHIQMKLVLEQSLPKCLFHLSLASVSVLQLIKPNHSHDIVIVGQDATRGNAADLHTILQVRLSVF